MAKEYTCTECGEKSEELTCQGCGRCRSCLEDAGLYDGTSEFCLTCELCHDCCACKKS